MGTPPALRCIVMCVLTLCSANALAQASSQTFGCGPASFTVPAGVNAVTVEAHGGSGTAAPVNRYGVAGGPGGPGAKVRATLPVSSGQTLNLVVACVDVGPNGGWGLVYGGNGAGAGVAVDNPAGAGGGASGVTSGGFVLIAAGGDCRSHIAMSFLRLRHVRRSN